MLEIALAPAAIAHAMIDQGRRAFLVAAGRQDHHPRRPAAPPQQSRLDHVMAHDVPTERFGARQARQAAAFGESACAQDRVVAPEGRLRARPPVETGRRGRTVERGGELLPAGEQSAAADQLGIGLHQAEAGILLDRQREPDHRLAGHQAVGIEHDHRFVAAAEADDPFGDVAGLARRVDRAAAIEDGRSVHVAQAAGHGALVHLCVHARIAQDEEIEEMGRTCAAQGCRHARDAHADRRDVLVVDRHQDRDPLGRQAESLWGGIVPRAHHDAEAGAGVQEAERDPGEERQAEQRDALVDEIEAVERQRTGKAATRDQADQAAARDQEGAAPDEGARGRQIIGRRRTIEILFRHDERLLVRQIGFFPASVDRWIGHCSLGSLGKRKAK